MLLRMIKGESVVDPVQVLRPELVVRESTARVGA
jgi:DNA-binding LacI/PurR family transcriptional regulator